MACFLVCLGFIADPISGALTSLWQTSTGEVVTWVGRLVTGRAASIFLLPSRAKDLRRETRDLMAARKSTLEEIERGRLERKKPTAEAQNWLEDVEKVDASEREFQDSFREISGFSPQLYSRFGCDADELKEEVRRLTAQRKDFTVLCEATPDPVVPWPSSSTSIVGAEDALSRIRTMLEDDSPPIIGVYGMGGVGKTTLLKAINNELFQTKSHKFDLVIRVTVSHSVNIGRIQEEIGDRLGFSGGRLPSDEEQRRRILCESLVQKKFLLLLDDLWRRLDLVKIGIPVPLLSEKGSKVVFTTRSTDVCNRMDAVGSKVQVRPLSQAKSWELFCEKLGKREDGWNEKTETAARKVAKKCGGLPLALITVGHAMADATTDGEWELALTMLPELMVESAEEDDTTDVLTVLKFSFDRLKDRRLKECLLYCALYPEDEAVFVPDLIDYWVAEGLLEREDRPCSIDEARNVGRSTVTALKAACLLEDGEEVGEKVKLHDLVREMALWITSRACSEERNVFLVATGKEQLDAALRGETTDVFLSASMRERADAMTPERWIDATRISLIQGGFEQLPQMSRCQNLRTLLLRENRDLIEIPAQFFQFMTLLTVLDLSFTGIIQLPREIGLLVELRRLNLSGTTVKSLPKEIGKLTKLIILDLSGTPVQSIPKEAISSLSRLQVLRNFEGYEWMPGRLMDGDDDSVWEGACLGDLESLELLNDVSLNIGIKCDEDKLGLLNCHRLCSVLRLVQLSLGNCLSFDVSDVLEAVKSLESLKISGSDAQEHLIFPADGHTKLERLTVESLPCGTFSCRGDVSMREIARGATFKSLKSLILHGCSALLEITWIGELPCLEEFELSNCDQMVEAVANPGASHEKDFFFPRLETISLRDMHNLESICAEPLLFPSLKKLMIFVCPKLRKLPFHGYSAENMSLILGPSEWWNGLEWECDDIKSKFLPCFEECPDYHGMDEFLLRYASVLENIMEMQTVPSEWEEVWNMVLNEMGITND